MQIPLLSNVTVNNGQQPFLANLYFALFLRRIVQEDFVEAQEYLAKAVRLFPGLLFEQPKKLSQSIVDCAFSQSSASPLNFAQNVLDNMPNKLRGQAQLRRSVLSKIQIAQAFEEYASSHGPQACRHIFTAVRYDPSFLKNKGVISILAKSVLNHYPSDIGPFRDAGDRDETIPRSVLTGVEAALGSTVDRVEPLQQCWFFDEIETILRGSATDSVRSVESTSWNNGVYLIEAGTQPYILRLVEKNVLQQRIAVVERVRAVGVPVPAVLASSGRTTTNNEPAWLLEEWMSGSWFEPPKISQADELTIVTELGRYLRHLHTIKTKGFGLISSPQLNAPFQTFEAWLDHRQQAIEKTCLTGAISETALPALDTAANFLRQSYTGLPVLCHCDLQRTNILIDGRRITAIIDWEEQEACDPAYDIAILMNRMGIFWYPAKDKEILTAVFRGYDPDDPDDFYRRVIAHRLLFAAREVARLVNQGEELEYLRLYRSILEDATLVNKL